MIAKDLSIRSVYDGNHFSVSRLGDDWGIWRFTGDDGDREWIILSAEGMEEVAEYFDKFYAEDRALPGF